MRNSKICKCGKKAEVKMYDYDGTVENVCWDCFIRDDGKSYETKIKKNKKVNKRGRNII